MEPNLSDGEFVLYNRLVSEYKTGDTVSLRIFEETGAVIYPYKVRNGNVFVLGDNRNVSVDSRAFGEVSKRQIKGRIMLRMGKWYIHGIKNF